MLFRLHIMWQSRSRGLPHHSGPIPSGLREGAWQAARVKLQ